MSKGRIEVGGLPKCHVAMLKFLTVSFKMQKLTKNNKFEYMVKAMEFMTKFEFNFTQLVLVVFIRKVQQLGYRS